MQPAQNPISDNDATRYHFLENDFEFDTEQRTDCEATNAVDWLEDGVQFGEYIEAYQLTT